MRKRVAMVLVLIFLIPSVWSQSANIRGASAQTNSGLNESSSLLNPKFLWQEQLSYPPNTIYDYRDWCSPTVVDGVVYVGATTVINCYPFYMKPNPSYILDWWSDFYAINASNGAIIWDYKDHAALIEGSLAVADGLVFFSAGEGIHYDDVNSVIALNSENGNLVWNFTKKGEISSPAVSNGIVYLNNRSAVYALNATDGNEIWEAPNYSGTLPIVNKGILYVGYFTNGPTANDEFIPSYSMNALNASNGKVLWNYTTGFWVSTPAVIGEVVYFSAENDIYALNAITGAKIWNYTTPHTPRTDGIGDTLTYEFTSPTVSTGILYIFSVRAGTLLALKAFNGAQLWNYTHAVGNPPAVANGVVYVDIDGCLSALNAYNGYKIWDSSLSANDLNSVPSKSTAIDENAMYFSFGTDVFSALQLPPQASQTSLPTIMQALTDEGQTVNIAISGNVTGSDISNVYLTTDQNTTSAYLYLTVTGVAHTMGFSNMTLPKSLIYDGTEPTIYIDGKKAEKQGFTQDTTNFYVWYMTDFSNHQISINFSLPQSSTSLPSSGYEFWIWASFSIILILTVAVGLLIYIKKHKFGINPQVS
jgi:outer membrane protein assembly factor BamB